MHLLLLIAREKLQVCSGIMECLQSIIKTTDDPTFLLALKVIRARRK
jgi:hypothetical protein